MSKNHSSHWCGDSKRYAIYNRDGFCCVFCGKGSEMGEGLSLDHILACELGGTNESTNLVTTCFSCNSAKQDKTMRDWLKYLREEKGVDTTGMAKRVSKQAGKAIDMKKGRELYAMRRVAKGLPVK